MAYLNKKEKTLLIDRYGNLFTVITIAKDRLLSDCGTYMDIEAIQKAAHSLYRYTVDLVSRLEERKEKEEVKEDSL